MEAKNEVKNKDCELTDFETNYQLSYINMQNVIREDE